MSFPSSPPALPAIVARFAVGRPVRAVWVNELGGVTFRVDSGMGAGCEFIKVARRGTADFANEARRLRWAAPYLAVPRVLGVGNAGVAHTCSNPKRGVALVTATAAPAIAGQRYCEFNGTAWVLIHAVAGIWSHIGGQVSGSAWALGAAMSVANKRPATSIVARINRIGNAPIRAQS